MSSTLQSRLPKSSNGELFCLRKILAGICGEQKSENAYWSQISVLGCRQLLFMSRKTLKCILEELCVPNSSVLLHSLTKEQGAQKAFAPSFKIVLVMRSFCSLETCALAFECFQYPWLQRPLSPLNRTFCE